ncbi:hypothetical protein EC957_000225 [Mortierella hygrophila]|uniref:Uncharacterized protein n=1 Tax=Mortierella hygrophila TaxID=979708 RepID=A0A9P6FGU8_9FUNG|nr:hypothetical protein EC957_000225 [Mortierella hygrophila]
MARTKLTRSSRITLLLALVCLLAILQTTLAADPISYCKCVCGQEKYIVALPRDAQHPIFGGSSKACGSCTKKYCLDMNSDMCKDVGTGGGDELTTICFERDSYKDQFIVYLFLTITFGLLGFAVLQPFLNGLWQRRQQRSYAQMPM